MNTFRLKVIDFSNDFENHSEGITTSSYLESSLSSSYDMIGSGAGKPEVDKLITDYQAALKTKGITLTAEEIAGLKKVISLLIIY